MTTDEWYRHTTWTDQDREDFHSRLKRARRYNRPEYLRIQAYYLAEAGNHPAALELLEQFFELDDGSLDLAMAQLQYAESLFATGHPQQAAQAFRDCLETERKRPNVQTDAWVLFAWHAIEAGQTELFSEAHAVLNEFEDLRTRDFPVQIYRYHAVKAILLQHEGNTPQAIEHANQAFKASQADESGYRYHSQLGLVENIKTPIHARLMEITAAKRR